MSRARSTKELSVLPCSLFSKSVNNDKADHLMVKYLMVIAFTSCIRIITATLGGPDLETEAQRS
jgi:hypothetical protein